MGGYKIEDQTQAYFLTLTVEKWVDVFSRKIYRDIIIDTLRFCQQNKGLEIFAFVVMTNHIHLVVRSAEGKLSSTIREFKSYSAKQIIEAIKTEPESRRQWMCQLFKWSAVDNKRSENYQFWQRDNHPEVLYSPDFIDQKINYIHQNPVKAGFVLNPEDYLYSSAMAYAGLPCLLDVIVEF